MKGQHCGRGHSSSNRYSQDNNCSLNGSKMKEIVINFRKCRQLHVPMSNDAKMVMAESFKFLGINIINDQLWTNRQESTPTLLLSEKTEETWHVNNDLLTSTDSPEKASSLGLGTALVLVVAQSIAQTRHPTIGSIYNTMSQKSSQ